MTQASGLARDAGTRRPGPCVACLLQDLCREWRGKADVAAAAVIAAPEGWALTPSRRGSPGCSGSEEALHSGNLPSQGKEEKGDSEMLGTCRGPGSADASL